MPKRRFMPLWDKLIGPRRHTPQPPGPNELPPLPKGAAHYHVCACGNYLTCYSAPDHCPISGPWDCPSCERRALDEFYNRERSEHPNAHLRH